MKKIEFNFTGASQLTPIIPGIEAYLKKKDAARDVFFILVDETSSFTGTIEIMERQKIDSTTYMGLAGTITATGSYAFVMNPAAEYFVRSNSAFSGTATGVFSSGTNFVGVS